MATRSGSSSVARWVAAGVACVLVVALTGLTGATPAVALSRAGHWVYSHSLGAVVHIGSNDDVDSKVPVGNRLTPAEKVADDEKNGYVVDRRHGRLIVFGKATLSVGTSLSVGTTENPVMLQVPGGISYLVYRKAGIVIRFAGSGPARVAAGGPVASPVATSDGTVWLQRTDTGQVCRLGPKARTLSCRARVPRGHDISVVALDDKPSVVDRTDGTVRRIGKDGRFAGGGPARSDIPRDGLVAASDAGGRLAIVSPRPGGTGPQLQLVDVSDADGTRTPAAPITRALPAGDYDAPVATGGVVVLVNQSTGTIRTYDNEGNEVQTVETPAGTKRLHAYRGQDGRVYVDNDEGTRTWVVDGSGRIRMVDIAHPGPGNGPATPPSPSPGRTTAPGNAGSGSPSGPPSRPGSSSSGAPSGSPSDSPSTTAAGTTGRGGGDRTGGPTTPRTSRTRSGPVPSVPVKIPRQGGGSDNGGRGDGGGRSSGNTNGNTNGNTGGSRNPGGNTGNGPVAGGPGATTTAPSAPKAQKPDRPGAVSAKGGVEQVAVSWTKPANNGAKLTGFRVTLTRAGTQVASRTTAAGRTSATFTGLTGGTSYVAHVAARNRLGYGPQAASAATTAKKKPVKNPAPAQPANLTASAVANPDGSVTVNWSGGPAGTNYTVQKADENASNSQASDKVYGGTGHTVTVPAANLEQGRTITFLVLSSRLGFTATNRVTPNRTNGGGNGSANLSSCTNKQTGVNGEGATAVANLTSKAAGAGKATLTWAAPGSPGQGKLVGYEISVQGGATTDVGAGTTSATVAVNGNWSADVQGLTVLDDGRCVYGQHATVGGQSGWMADQGWQLLPTPLGDRTREEDMPMQIGLVPTAYWGVRTR